MSDLSPILFSNISISRVCCQVSNSRTTLNYPSSMSSTRVLMFLKEEEYIDIIGSEGGFTERSFQYVIAPKGRGKVHEVLNRSSMPGQRLSRCKRISTRSRISRSAT